MMMQDGKYVISKSYMGLIIYAQCSGFIFLDKKGCILCTTSANISMVCVQNNGDSYFFVFRQTKDLVGHIAIVMLVESDR
jgi:hypothetical protein